MKINKLSDSQISKFPEYVEKYLKLGLRTTPINMSEAIPIVHDIQKNLLERKETPVVLMRSPLEAWKCVCYLLRDQIRAQVRDQVRDQVWGQVSDQLSAQVEGNIRAQVGDQVRHKVWDQLSAQVEDQIRDHVRDQIGYQLRDQIRAQVEGNVKAQVNIEPFVWPYIDGSMSSPYYSWLSFMIDVLGLKIGKKLSCLYEVYKKSINLSLMYPLNNICVLSDFPVEINIQDKVLHCEGGPSILYSDGFCCHSLWGVPVPKWLAETNLELLDIKKILKIKNADVKAVGLKRFGPERIVNEGYGTVIEDRFNESGYKLVDLSTLFKSFDYAPHLYMSNPSVKGLVHCEGVPPEIKTIEAALKWREDRVNEDFYKVTHT